MATANAAGNAYDHIPGAVGPRPDVTNKRTTREHRQGLAATAALVRRVLHEIRDGRLHLSAAGTGYRIIKVEWAADE